MNQKPLQYHHRFILIAAMGTTSFALAQTCFMHVYVLTAFQTLHEGPCCPTC